MSTLNVKDLKEDMVIANDIKDCRGRLLLRKDTVLNQKNLKLCKMWGVVEADIKGMSSEEAYASAIKNFQPTTIEAAKEIVLERFRHNDMHHPAIEELSRLCILRTAEGARDGDNGILSGDWSYKDRGGIEDKKPVNINVARFIREDTNLSTLPDIYRQIIDAISMPGSSVYDIENVISKDPNLASRLLKIVNSAFYGYPCRIDTLSRAVNVVGTKQLSTLAIGINITYKFKNIPSEIINMKKFWQHSILCGICARIIAGYKNVQNTERLFVAGLLHDIGRLMLYNYLPQEFSPLFL